MPEERELKLIPADAGLLDRLALVERLGVFEPTGRRHEAQRNSFFDTDSRGLARARVGFRRRTVAGVKLATWSLKGDAALAANGVASRSEVEVHLEADLAPALALGVLRQVAREQGAAALAEQTSDGLADGRLPRKEPLLESATDRQIVDLVAPARGWAIELALDRVRLIGHDFAEIEIEAELKRGEEAALDAARAAIEALGDVRDASGSKLSRALDHLAACACASRLT